MSLPSNDEDDDVETHGAMDNFDHDESTFSGIGGSNDTILMVFENSRTTDTSINRFSKKKTHVTQQQRSLDHVLPCQELIKM